MQQYSLDLLGVIIPDMAYHFKQMQWNRGKKSIRDSPVTPLLLSIV